MPRPRKIIDAGSFTIDLRNLEYMEKVVQDNYFGIRYVFFSGAHKTALYYTESRRNDEYRKQISEFQKYNG